MTVIGILGPPVLTFTSISGITEEFETEELPDLTVASMGRSKPVDFSASLPQHHRLEQIAMEGWLAETRDPISPLYKKPATVSMTSIGGRIFSYTLIDCYPYRRKLPDLDMANDGDMAETEWSFRASLVLPLLFT